MTELKKEIEAFEAMRVNLESKYLGRWVVFHNKELVGDYESLSDAATDALKKFGRAPYLIRRVGVEAFTLPASVLYRPVYESP